MRKDWKVYNSKQFRRVLLSVFASASFAPALPESPQSFVAFQPKSVFASLRNEVKPESVYLGGQSIGIRLNSKGVLVVGFERVNHLSSPAETAHLQLGDVIQKIGSTPIDSISDLKGWITQHPSVRTLPLVVKRGRGQMRLAVPLAQDESGRRHLGLFVRDRTSGVGTLTFYDENHHRYGALGHVITDSDTGKPVEGWGHVYDSEIFGVVKGTCGKPGEKRGRFVQPNSSLGSIDTNSNFGVFGNMGKAPPHLFQNKPVEVASPSQVHDGHAELLTVIHGQQVQGFQVTVENAVHQSKPATKSMIIHVTDPRLLETTGGIVQGMSGSPVLQDGKLIGAVTHVFVSDPTRGYGVYAQWMLKESEAQKYAANAHSAWSSWSAWRKMIWKASSV